MEKDPGLEHTSLLNDLVLSQSERRIGKGISFSRLPTFISSVFYRLLRENGRRMASYPFCSCVGLDRYGINPYQCYSTCFASTLSKVELF